VCLSRRFLFLDGKMVDFGGCCCFITRFKSPENGVDDALSSWKMDIQLWIEKKESLFGDFGTSVMILQ
jgi:hypothetical protein